MWRRMLLACSALLCAFCACAAMAEHDKRAEIAPAPFVMGSRYGRSLPRVMTPRNDRFFMGSRYGKRSGPEMEPLPQLSPPPGLTSALTCHYTGVPDLYRCTRSPLRHATYDRKGEEENDNLDED